MKRVLKIDPANFPKKINRSFGFKIKNIAYENLNEKKYKSKIHKKASQISKFLQDKGIDFSLQVIRQNEIIPKNYTIIFFNQLLKIQICFIDKFFFFSFRQIP